MSRAADLECADGSASAVPGVLPLMCAIQATIWTYDDRAVAGWVCFWQLWEIAVAELAGDSAHDRFKATRESLLDERAMDT